jgi:hypothetical protein
LGAASRSTIGGCRIGNVGVDLVVTRGTFVVLALSSNSRLEGGRGGSLASPNAGGSFLCESTDEALVVVDPWLRDIPDIVELIDCSEELDPRRTSCVEVFRGGRAGVG